MTSPEDPFKNPEREKPGQAVELLALRYVQGGEATADDWHRTGELISDTGEAIRLEVHLFKDEYLRRISGGEDLPPLSVTRISRPVTLGNTKVERFEFVTGQEPDYSAMDTLSQEVIEERKASQQDLQDRQKDLAQLR